MDVYQPYLRGERRDPSRIAVFLPGWAQEPSAADAIARLGAHDIQATEVDAGPGATWTIAGDWGRLSCLETDMDPEYLERFADDLSDSEREAAKTAHVALEAEMELPEPLLESYRDQLRLLHHVAPDAIAVHDRSSFRWQARSWWIDALEVRTPPSPDNLFTIHAVSDEDGSVWLHTHGLGRGGSIELEVLGATREQAGGLGSLLRHAALLMLENGTPDPVTEFEVGHEMEVCWRPWEEVVGERDADALGGRSDRDDPEHTGARGVLSMPGERFRSVAELTPVLDDNPVFWVSNMETRRMEMLAVERFPAFRELVQRFSGADGWGFAAKIGYRIDPEEDGDIDDLPSEHLWFDVHGIDGVEIDATLLNEPYNIERMHAGDRGMHPVDQLSDWNVYSPWGSAGPDRVGLVFQRLADEADS